MRPETRPLRPDDLEELSRFLTEGFRAPADADFAAPDVLRWKYLEPIGDDAAPRSLVACDEGGRIVGHAGFCATSFQGGGLPPEGVATRHIIDWLGSREHRTVGSSLMRQVHRGAPTQYVLVANDLARRVGRGAGYATLAEVPVFHKVLRPGYRWREAGRGLAGRLLRVARDAARAALRPGRRPRVGVALRRVAEFGPEVGPILDDCRRAALLTGREPARLNHALRYPRPGISGWLVLRDGRVVGFALLNVVRQGEARAGKVVECLLEGREPDLWHAAVAALTAELRDQGADFAVGLGSTPWMAEALRRAGFVASHRLEFGLRDRDGLIPHDATFHVSPFDADSAYQ